MASEFNRKDLLLMLLFAAGPSNKLAEPIDGRTRLMKLLFILQTEFQADKLLNLNRKYEFQAYHYGPFTKDVYDDLEFLENVGLIEVVSKGNASPVDQNEDEKLTDDISIGEEDDESGSDLKQESFALTERGYKFVKEKLAPDMPDQVVRAIDGLKNKFGAMPLTSILRYVYSKHPDYAANTKLQYLTST